MSSALADMTEASFRDVVVGHLDAHGWKVRREVSYRWHAGGRDVVQDGRLDLFLEPPRTWPYYTRWPQIGVEAKRATSSHFDPIRTVANQAISAMSGFDFHHKGEVVPRPHTVLVLTPETWEGRMDGTSRRVWEYVERDLWTYGCGLMVGPSSGASFLTNAHGLNSRRIFLYGDWT